MSDDRDIVVIAGPFASGKTVTSNFLQEYCNAHAILVEKSGIADGQFLIPRMKIDDVLKGYNHYHKWSKKDSHSHKRSEPELPFTTYGHYLVDGMYYDFFQYLSKLPKTGKYWIVNWSGGINKQYPLYSPFRYDYSFERVGAMLKKGLFESAWLPRVKAIIHPVTTWPLRVILNKNRSIPTPSEIAENTASWVLSMEALMISQGDDFSKIEKLFRENGTAQIYHPKNTGNNMYFNDLIPLIENIFTKKLFLIQKNVQKQNRDIVLIVGRPGVGKKTLLNTIYHIAKNNKIEMHNKIISDSESLIKKVIEDDSKGGYNHYHDWCKDAYGGHSHKNGQEKFPYIITNEQFVNDIYRSFFQRIMRLPSDGKLWFIEWTGGINLNSHQDPSSKVSFSYERLGTYLNKKYFPSEWYQRLFAIIHPMCNNDIREQLDESKEIKSLERLQKNIISPKKNYKIYQMYGQDDFFATEKYLHKSSVPHIYHFEHSGKSDLSLASQNISDLILYSFSRIHS